MSINIINSQGVELWIADINPPADITCADLKTAVLGGTQIDCPQSLGELAETRDVTEYKCLSSGESAKALGAISIGSFEVSVLHDPSNPSSGQNLLRAAFANNTQFYMGVKLPDADETMYIFKAGVSSQNVTVEQDAAIMGNYTIEVASEIRECNSKPMPFQVLVHAPTQADAIPTMFTGVNADVPYDPTTISTSSVVDNGDGSYLITSEDAITGIHWYRNTAVTAIDIQSGTTLTHFQDNPNGAPTTWALCSDCTSLTSFKTTVELPSLTNVTYAWDGCTGLTSFDASGLTAVTKVDEAWNSCTSLTSFDTSPLTAVTNASRAWYNCTGLTSFDTSPLTALTNASRAWQNCTGLTSFDTSPLTAVLSADYAWNGCTGLTSFDASGLTAVTSLVFTWQNCTGLTSFDASGLTAVTDISFAWYTCAGITSFDTSGLTAVTNASYAWNGCTGLTSFDTSPLTAVTNAIYAWYSCASLTSFDTSPLTAVTDTRKAWENCAGLTSFDASGLTAVTSISEAWRGCIELLCITSFVAPNCTNVRNAFVDTPKLVHPDANEQITHFTSTGVDWTNPAPCP